MYHIIKPLHCGINCLILKVAFKVADGSFIKNRLMDFVLGLEQNYQQFIK